MTIFELADFVPNEDLTLRMRSRAGLKLFGDFAISYGAVMILPILSIVGWCSSSLRGSHVV